jgi:hypothetical protein
VLRFSHLAKPHPQADKEKPGNMIGLEVASAVGGLIGLTISVVQGSIQIYDAVKDKSGIPEKLRKVSDTLPSLAELLKGAKTQFDKRQPAEQAWIEVEKDFRRCHEACQELREILESAYPKSDTGTVGRVFKNMGNLVSRKNNTAEQLLKEIHGYLEVLKQRQIITNATLLDDIKKTVDELFPRPGLTQNNVSGTNVGGDQVFHNNNTGHGQQFNGPGGTFNFGSKWNQWLCRQYVGISAYSALGSLGPMFHSQLYGFGLLFVTEIQHPNVMQSAVTVGAPLFCNLSLSVCHVHISQEHSEKILADRSPLDTRTLKELDPDHVHMKLQEWLRFPSIDDRRADITNAHRDTFRWVLSPATSTEDCRTPGSDFVEWLRSGSGVYWIQGKMGCGKSTLMKYVTEQELTKTHLREWANGQVLHYPTCYFSKIGTSELQQSLQGL